MLAAQTRKMPVFNIKGALRLFIKSGEEEPSPTLMQLRLVTWLIWPESF